MLILGIESSCDETSAAIVEDGKKILSNIIASQADIHARFGGVVPEIASRAHAEAIHPLCMRAFEQANICISDIDAVAVTYAPGLIGALLVGVGFAKALAYRYRLPLIPVHHIRGHIASTYLSDPAPEPPFLAFIASGGHTSIIAAESRTSFRIIGSTRDDAAGEAFDKVARSLGLPYPGGAALETLSLKGNAEIFHIPMAKVEGSELDFTFSGVKTHIINYIRTIERRGESLSDSNKADIAAAFTNNVIKAICSRIEKALRITGYKTLVCAGGVLANSQIRAALNETARQSGTQAFIAEKSLCGDNAAMIAAQGYYEYLSGSVAGLDLNALASLDV